MSKISVLFICMGNICRSPTAHGIFQQKVNERGLSDQITVDSAGTHAYHIGEAPDKRSQETAVAHGYDLSDQRARQVTVYDFNDFDYVIGMDNTNHYNLSKLATEDELSKVHSMMSFAKDRSETEVPDPYYGADGFENVFEMIEVASEGLLDQIVESQLKS